MQSQRQDGETGKARGLSDLGSRGREILLAVVVLVAVLPVAVRLDLENISA